LETLPKVKREHILNFIFLKLRRFSNPRHNGKPLEADSPAIGAIGSTIIELSARSMTPGR
jgi:hypothetical protein